MPFSRDVTLLAHVQPRFPGCCCVCGRDHPGDLLRLGRRRWSWFEMLFPWIWFVRRPVHVEVPICSDCRNAEIWRRWLQNLGLVIVLAAAGVLASWWIEPLASRGVARRWVVFGVAALIGAPVIVWHLLHPPAVDLTIAKDWIVYEFRSRDYARAFGELNGVRG